MPRTLTHTLSFRITAIELNSLAELKATFTPPTWANVFRWILDQPETKDVVAERLAQMSPRYHDFTESRKRDEPTTSEPRERRRRLGYSVDAERLDELAEMFMDFVNSARQPSVWEPDEEADGSSEDAVAALA